MFCTNCGKQIDDDALYCNHCGINIENYDVEVKKSTDLDIKPSWLCILFLSIGIIFSIIDIIDIYGREKTINFGQIIFIIVFIIGIISLWRSNKIGATLLIAFVTFKMIISLKYYFEIDNEYFLSNLILDEIFYIAIILLILAEWRTKWKDKIY